MIADASTYLSGASYAIYDAIQGTNVTIKKLTESPILLSKAVKNEVEAQGMIEAHVKDALALCKFASHFETEIKYGNNWTELSAAVLLSEYRSQQNNSRGISFHPISAFGSNGAIIHYSSTNETNKAITKDGLYMRKLYLLISISVYQITYLEMGYEIKHIFCFIVHPKSIREANIWKEQQT